jgi:hypothetical protein
MLSTVLGYKFYQVVRSGTYGIELAAQAEGIIYGARSRAAKYANPGGLVVARSDNYQGQASRMSRPRAAPSSSTSTRSSTTGTAATTSCSTKRLNVVRRRLVVRGTTRRSRVTAARPASVAAHIAQIYVAQVSKDNISDCRPPDCLPGGEGDAGLDQRTDEGPTDHENRHLHH